METTKTIPHLCRDGSTIWFTPEEMAERHGENKMVSWSMKDIISHFTSKESLDDAVSGISDQSD